MENVDVEVIDSFTDEAGYGFLSTFFPSTIYVDGLPYPTVTHAMEAHKTLDPKCRDLIRRAKTPQEAKKLGRAVILREDWSEVRQELMRQFTKKKFENPFLRPLLLGTGNARLVYSNTWNDTYFGVCRGKGENWLGKILEETRELASKEDV